jgi:hypothetical protein
VRKPNKTRRSGFSDAEIEILRAIYPTAKTHEEVTEALPGRTIVAIRSMASRLEIRRHNRIKAPAIDGAINRYDVPTYVDQGGDKAYVKACLKLGGFPAAHSVEGRTVWVWPNVGVAA